MLAAFLIVVFILILLSGAFLITPLQFGIGIIKTADKDEKTLYFRLFGIPIKIPIKPFKKGEHDKQKKESTLSFENFSENVSDFKELYKTSKDELKEMLSYARHHLSVERVDFEIRFGFDNAAATGISTGAIWGMGSFLLKVVDTLLGIKKINMQVNPDFNNKVFEIYLKTILIIKPIHFIIILRKFVKTYIYIKKKINNIKGGARNGRTSY